MSILFCWILATAVIAIAGLVICLFKGIRKHSVGLLLLAPIFAWHVKTTVVPAFVVLQSALQSLGVGTAAGPTITHFAYETPFVDLLLIAAILLLARQLAGSAVPSEGCAMTGKKKTSLLIIALIGISLFCLLTYWKSQTFVALKRPVSVEYQRRQTPAHETTLAIYPVSMAETEGYLKDELEVKTKGGGYRQDFWRGQTPFLTDRDVSVTQVWAVPTIFNETCEYEGENYYVRITFNASGKAKLLEWKYQQPEKSEVVCIINGVTKIFPQFGSGDAVGQVDIKLPLEEAKNIAKGLAGYDTCSYQPSRSISPVIKNNVSGNAPKVWTYADFANHLNEPPIETTWPHGKSLDGLTLGLWSENDSYALNTPMNIWEIFSNENHNNAGHMMAYNRAFHDDDHLLITDSEGNVRRIKGAFPSDGPVDLGFEGGISGILHQEIRRAGVYTLQWKSGKLESNVIKFTVTEK